MITIVLNPMIEKRGQAVDHINTRFSHDYLSGAYRRQAHQRKAAQARAAMTGDVAPVFSTEATLRGLSVSDFADLVLSKAAADESLDAFELERQRKLLAVEAAATPAEIDAILKGQLNG